MDIEKTARNMIRNIEKNLKKPFKNNIVITIIISSVVSAIVGGVFGFYGATFFNQEPPIALPKIIKNNEPTQTPLPSEDQRTVEVIKRVVPAVVSIVATKDLTIIERGYFNPFEDFCDDPFFRRFLGNFCDRPSQPPRSYTERRKVSAGSGFIISSDGLIVTNKHVIDIKEADFTVITYDNKKYPATILAKDPIQDIAIMKISATNLPYLPLGDSDKLQIGQTVIAIGNALGEFSNTVSKGVISGLSRSIVASSGRSTEKLDEVIQTDAAINPGNSGGPLVNLNGEVIGINTAVVQDAQNIGFAIPINHAKRDIQQVKVKGKITYPFLGVRYVLINEEIRKNNNLSVDYGALVIRGESKTDLAVLPGSPADKAGIQENDIILEVNGKKINQKNDLVKIIQSYNVGDVITLKILSKGKEKFVTVTLGERQ